jgi:hypothetical protein
MANGSGGGSDRVVIIPPPPPRAAQVVSLVLALLAAIFGFMGMSLWAGVTAGGSFLVGLWDVVSTRRSMQQYLADQKGQRPGGGG